MFIFRFWTFVSCANFRSNLLFDFIPLSIVNSLHDCIYSIFSGFHRLFPSPMLLQHPVCTLKLHVFCRFTVVAIVLPFDFSIFNPNPEHKRIRYCWCKSLSLWQNKLKNKKNTTKKFVVVHSPTLQTKFEYTKYLHGGMDIAIDVIPFSVCPKHRDANGRWTSKKTTALEKCELRVLNLSSSNATLLFRYFGTFVVNSLRLSSISPSNRRSMDDFVSFYLSFGCILYLWSDAMHQKSNAKQTIKN